MDISALQIHYEIFGVLYKSERIVTYKHLHYKDNVHMIHRYH
jgi:hypothetical protein